MKFARVGILIFTAMNFFTVMGVAHAGSQPRDKAEANTVQQFKKLVTQKFVNEMNDPHSDLGKKIAAINVETTDGRNNQGIIPLPIVKSEIRVQLVSYEDTYVPSHYRSQEGDICSSTTDETTFVIMVPTFMQVHMAGEFGYQMFKISLRHILAQKVLDSAITDCATVDTDTLEKALGPTKITTEILPPGFEVVNFNP